MAGIAFRTETRWLFDVRQCDRRYVIQTSVVTDDGRAGQNVTWVNGNDWWARKSPLVVRESLQAGALQNASIDQLQGRYVSDLTIKNRLYWPLRDKTFEILSLREREDLGRDRVIELECAEVDA